MQIEQDLIGALQLDWTFKNSQKSNGQSGVGEYEGSVDLLVRHMWRSAAVINMLCREVQSSGLRPSEKSVIIRIIQYLCSALIVCFHSEIMDCLVSVLQWVLVIAPSLRSIVSVEISAMFLDTAKRRLGIFSSHVGGTYTDTENEKEKEESDGKSLLTAGSYSVRLKDFVRHSKTAGANPYDQRQHTEGSDKGRSGKYVNSQPLYFIANTICVGFIKVSPLSSFPRCSLLSSLLLISPSSPLFPLSLAYNILFFLIFSYILILDLQFSQGEKGTEADSQSRNA